ncbi:MAG: PaaI family thioesterase [Silicimonas sp.]|nr:PaaI family thioesterase [Silicimonas sp.]
MAVVELTRWPLKLAETLGYRVAYDPERQEAHCTLEMGDLHHNPRGTLHGGITATLLDTASGLTAGLSEDPQAELPALTLSMSINYLAAVPSGRLTAIGRVTGGGRKTKFVDGELRDETGTLIATSTGVFKLLPSEKENAHARP